MHDFDPGIRSYPSGLFWTLPLERHDDDDGLTVDLDDGSARMAATNVRVHDFFNIPNALFRLQNPVSSDAMCSYRIRWSGPVTSSSPVTTPGSSGTVIANQATLTWSGRNALGFSFKSNPSGTTSKFAQLGRVENGVYFTS